MTNQLPREIYLRRRVAAVIVLVVVLAVLWWIIAAITPNGDKTDPAAMTTTPTSASAPAAASAAASATVSTPAGSTDVAGSEVTGVTTGATPTGTVTATATTPSATTSPAKATCELSDLVVTASPNQANYEGDTRPEFSVTIQNPTAADCEVDLDVSPIAFEVFDMVGNGRVWGDLDCNEPTGTGMVQFEPGQSRYYQATWSRTGSAPDQCVDRPAVGPGAYYLYVSVGDNHSAPVPFNII